MDLRLETQFSRLQSRGSNRATSQTVCDLRVSGTRKAGLGSQGAGGGREHRVHFCSYHQVQVTVPRDMAHVDRTAPGWGDCAGQAPGLQARRVQDGQVSGAHAWGLRGMGWQPGADHCCPPRTKIFIRFPKTLFATEDALEIRRQSLGERGAPPILASGVHSGKRERNHCIQASSPGRLPRPHWAARLVCSRIHTQHVPMLLCSLPRSFFFFFWLFWVFVGRAQA